MLSFRTFRPLSCSTWKWCLVLLLSSLCAQGEGIPWQTDPDRCWEDDCNAGNPLDQGNCSSEPRDCRVNLYPCFTPFQDVGRFYVEASYLPLRREPGGNLTYALRILDSIPGNNVINPLTTPGTPVLTTDDLQSGWESGARFAAGWRLGERMRVEGSYFGLAEFAGTAIAQDTSLNDAGGVGNLYSPFTDFQNPVDPSFVFDLNNFASTTLASTFHSGDVNFYHEWLQRSGRWRFTGIYGVRYVNIQERFRYVTSGVALPGATPARAALTHDVLTETDNRLVGPQFGGLVQYQLRGRAWIDFESKFAVVNNDGNQTTVYNRTNVLPVNNATFSARDARVAFVGDISASLRLQLTRFAILDMGYQATFLDGVALAQENVPFDPIALEAGPAVLRNNGDVIYHGPRLGVRLTW